MKWVGLYPTLDGVHIADVMITPSRTLRVNANYVTAHGEHAGTWHSNLALTRNITGTVLSQCEDPKGATMVEPRSGRNMLEHDRIQQAMGAIATAMVDNLGWIPMHKIPIDAIMHFALGSSRVTSLETLSKRAHADFYYKCRTENAAPAFWGAVFAFAIDFPQNEKFRASIISKYKKTHRLE